MAWDDDKSTAVDPDNPNADEQLTADEWDAHVTEGHFPADELNLGVESGDPVMTDPQNGDSVVLRYDRATGAWVLPAVTTDEASIGNVVGKLSWAGSGTNQTIADETATKVEWDNTGREDAAVFDVKQANNEIDVLVDGVYIVTAQVGWASGFSSGTRIQVRIFVNGSEEIRADIGASPSGNVESQSAPSESLDLTANDTIDIRVYQSSGSSHDLVQAGGGANLYGFFSVTRSG